MMLETFDSKLFMVKRYRPSIFYDARGEIFTVWQPNWFLDPLTNEEIRFVEDKMSVSKLHVLRGLHGDDSTWKLVYCPYGEFKLVVVDARKSSSNYRLYDEFILNDKNRDMVLIPPKHINAHLSLSDTCIFAYKQSVKYGGPSKQITVSYDDPEIGIYWNNITPIFAERDHLSGTAKDLYEVAFE